MSIISYLLLSCILAIFLFFPVSKLIWVLAIRRYEKKVEKNISKQEKKNQLKRSRIIAFFITITFSSLYVYNMI